MDINNRELATVIWIVILFTCLFYYHRDVRDSFCNVIKCFFDKKILFVVALSAIWMSIGVFILYKMNAWQWNNIKTTLTWFAFSIVTMIIGVSKAEDKKKYFLSLCKENINISVFLTFVIELYSFSFFIEFIMIPVSVLLSVYINYNILSKDNVKVRLLINIAFVFWVVAYFLHSIYLSISLFNTDWLLINLIELFLPVILSLIFIPFLYILSIYMEYERVFSFLKIHFNNDELFKYAKKLSLKSFKLNVDYLRRWNRNVRLNQVTSKVDLEKSVCDIKKLKDLESNPPFVSSNKGWSPYLARKFLEKDNLVTNDYHSDYDGKWWAYSRSLVIEEDNLFPDIITYYIYGNENVISKLKLKVDINNVLISEFTMNTILRVFDHLLVSSTKSTSIQISDCLMKIPLSIEVDNYIINFTKENFISNNGYTLELNISIK